MVEDKTIIFLFHRDLRLVDHYGLEAAAKAAKDNQAKVLPVFIFTPEQVTEKNPLKSSNSVQFMLQSLKELAAQIRQKGSRLLLLYGDNVDALNELKKSHNIIGLVETRDYTPYAKKRAKKLATWAPLYEAPHDLYLTEPGSIRTGTGKIYQKFTPYYEAAKRIHPPPLKGQAITPSLWQKPKSTPYKGEITITEAYKKFAPTLNPGIAVKGGRIEGLHLLKQLPTDYDKIRDHPVHRTSMLSAHNHFGTVSIREVFWAAKHKSPKLMEGFIRQLYWRDFHGALMEYFEDLYHASPYEFEGAANLRGHETDKAKADFKTWSKGETGHPLVDAGIKQLLLSGYMHNRVRLVVASYLVKDLKVYWRWGERFFAKHLVDYDPAQNMMNWINVSSLAPFGMAPFRRHDPEASRKRLDPDDEYINTWLKSPHPHSAPESNS